MLSIRQFCGWSRTIPTMNSLKLTGTGNKRRPKRKKLSNRSQEDLTLFDDLSAFENQPIRTVVIKNWPNEDFLYHVFSQAKYWKCILISTRTPASSSSWTFRDFFSITLHLKVKPSKKFLNSKSLIFGCAMLNCFFDTMLFINYFKDYTGNLKAFLDDTCGKLK